MPISSSMNHDQKWFLSFNPYILKPLYHSSDDKHFTGYLFPRQSRRKWVRYIDRRTRAGPRPGLWQGGLQVTFKQTPAQYCQVRPPPAARPPSLARRSGSIPGLPGILRRKCQQWHHLSFMLMLVIDIPSRGYWVYPLLNIGLVCYLYFLVMQCSPYHRLCDTGH